VYQPTKEKDKTMNLKKIWYGGSKLSLGIWPFVAMSPRSREC
jgi:hypothetical protein